MIGFAVLALVLAGYQLFATDARPTPLWYYELFMVSVMLAFGIFGIVLSKDSTKGLVITTFGVILAALRVIDFLWALSVIKSTPFNVFTILNLLAGLVLPILFMVGGNIQKNSITFTFLLMMTPGIVVLLINNYLPMLGSIMSFQQYRYRDNFINSLLNSEWVGLKNFEFLFRNPNLWSNLRNTILYNLAFIVMGMIVPVAFAIALNELWRPRLSKIYQTFFFLPYFLSWVVVAYLVFALFETRGAVNTMILSPLGIEPVNWYTTKGAWPPLLIFLNSWKYTGYNAVVYLASLSGISGEYYEAAMIDGVSKRQQIWYITLPLLRPVIIIMSLLAVGRIFNSDFGLFYNVPMGRSSVYPVTEVLDTYIYRAMIRSTQYGMPMAASMFQSVVGLITIISANFAVRKIDPDSALF